MTTIDDSLNDQLKAAIQLLGKRVRFNHITDGTTTRVCAVTSAGMVEIEGFSGQFAPHLFVVVPEIS